jgi:hypothetical protein
MFLMAVNYLAEINARAVYKPIIATPVDWLSRQYNVYYITLFKPKRDTYWIKWGGTYDTLETTRVEIYILDWLQKAASLQDVLNTSYLYYVAGDEGRLYFNAPKHPWLYFSYELQLITAVGFLHTVKNTENPSDSYIENDYLPVLLDKPSDDRKLSDPIHNAQLYLTFNITLVNDGRFDLIDPKMYFNGPARLYKTTKNNPVYDDFVLIRTGNVENVSVDDKKITFSCAESFRALNQNVCDTITKDDFDVPLIDGAEGKSIPIVFGSVEIELIKIYEEGENVDYICAEYIYSIQGVYDNDGNALAYSRNGLVIKASKDASYAKITGYTENRIGYIVTQLIEKRGGIRYIPTFWDTAETGAYRDTSPRVNIVISSGSVRSAVDDVIKSDLVFLIQKNNALFTIRSWNKQYASHSFESWAITQQAKLNWNEAQKYFFSACIVKFQKNARTGEFLNQYFNTDFENDVEERYNKKLTTEFETCLVNAADAKTLGDKLAERFTTLKAQMTIGVGKDTSGINLLDTVFITPDINGRVYSKSNRWRVLGVNPAQDTMTLVED